MSAPTSSMGENSANLLQIWQELYFTKDESDARQSADCIRGYLHQLQMSQCMGTLSSTACAQLLDVYSSEYQQLLDSPDGVSNYQEEILEAVKLKKSDKDLWKSELTPASVLKLGCVNDFIERNNEYSRDIANEKLDEKLSHSLRNLATVATLPTSPEPGNVVLSAHPGVQQEATHGKRKMACFENENVDKNPPKETSGGFHTAREQLAIVAAKKFGTKSIEVNNLIYGVSRKSLGGIGIRKNTVNNKFLAPIISKSDSNNGGRVKLESDAIVDDRLKNIDAKMVEMIMNEIMDINKSVTWDDIAGLDFAKKMVKEMVVLPMIRPDLCTRLRRPPKGLLLFGPPGTGKTLIGKVIASNSKSTFFSISASSLTSKWIGEGEKMVRALFAVAKCHQPAVIFIDEIDSLLTQRNDSEHEASRRMKTEFLVQLDGTTTQDDDRILVVGATNRPQELDEAARRRLAKKLYIPLPDLTARKQIINGLMTGENHSLSEEDIADIGLHTNGYSGADMANVCKEAAYGPIRRLSFEELESMPADHVRPISHRDFLDALCQVKASVSKDDLQAYEDWNSKFGSTSQ